MPRTCRGVLAGTVVAVALASLTACTMPFTTPVAVPTSPVTPHPAAPSSSTPALIPTGPPPALNNTGNNWAPMLASLLTYGQWLLANPNSGMVATMAAAGCPAAAALSTEMTSLSGESWRLAPAPLTISSLGAPSTLAAGQTTVTLPVQVSRAAETVVDTTGQAASRVAALPPTTFDVTVLLGADGKWRLCSARAALDPADRQLTALSLL